MRVAPDLTDRPLADLVSLSGRVAVVTGGGRGIGLATGRRLAEAGASVVLADLDADAAEHAASLIGGATTSAWVDVADATSVRSLVDSVAERSGRLDIWIGNAGIYPSTPLLETSDEEWDRVLDVDLRGLFIGAREAARAMVSTGGGGVVVNIASTASFRAAGTGVTHYVAAKHGVVGLTKGLAVELGRYGIRVLAVAPCVTRTPGLESERDALEAAGFTLEGLGAALPLGRVAVPDDVARVVLFCASDLAALMTGSTVLVDAGYLAT